jgi:hypothetical protein
VFNSWAEPGFLDDMETLLRTPHPVLWFDTEESDRVEAVLQGVADRLRLPFRTWDAHAGVLNSPGTLSEAAVTGTADLEHALSFVAKQEPAVTFFRGLGDGFESAKVRAQIASLARSTRRDLGAIVGSGANPKIPVDLAPYVTVLDLPPISEAMYRDYVRSVLQDLRTRMPVSVELTAAETARFLRAVQGLSFIEVRRLVARTIADDGKLDVRDIERVLAVKREIVEKSGVLELYPSSETLGDVAGLGTLKAWLGKRKQAFTDPDAAKAFGLTPPRGLLLVGVQGCGKSLSAKAVAAEWSLPLIRFDPAHLFDRYFGESEKNLRRAMGLADAMAPVVLWIDEIEKVFAQDRDSDGGTGSRIFGSFLTWMSEKRSSVFVVATANDVSRLPPELLRKGRFDEIFFLDLPNAETRVRILALHLARRARDPNAFDLGAIADATEGWSGAELEQVIVSALYGAFETKAKITTETLLAEVESTRPLSVTMRESVEALRRWAKERAVSAE